MPSADSFGNESSNLGMKTAIENALMLSTGIDQMENKRASDSGQDVNQERKRRRKSRWASDETEKTFIPGMPTVIPTTLSKEQEEAYVLQLQIEEVTRKLRTGDLGIPANPEERSPSPEPIYSFDGKRMNTREYRTRKKLEEERHQLIGRMIKINPEFKPPSDYKPPLTRVSDKVMIPQDVHPNINFVGLLIGPRGNTLKAMEHETGAKIIIRGKGSVKEGKVGRKDGQPLPGENEPLHAYVTANNPEYVKKAVEKIKDIIRQGVEVPEGQNDLRKQQLRELALLNGTLRENDGIRCTNCGATDHKSWTCPDKPNVTMQVICTICGGAGHIATDCLQKKPGMIFVESTFNAEKNKIDEEYMSLMAELGEGPPPPQRDDSQNLSSAEKLKSSTGNLFDRPPVPRAILPPQINLPTPPQLIPNTLPPPLWATQGNKMPNPSFSLPPPLPAQTNHMTHSSMSSGVPPIPPPSWQPNMMPPPFPFCPPANPSSNNNPMMPPHWMTPIGIPSTVAPTATTATTATNNTTTPQSTTTCIPVPSTAVGTAPQSSINLSALQANTSGSAWQPPIMPTALPPTWQTPFPFPPASVPLVSSTTASTTSGGNILPATVSALATSQLSSFLVAPPPPPPPPPHQ